MQSDIDAQLTNFFEEAPPREFATVMRGYDRHQVDEHIRQIEAEVRQHRDPTCLCSAMTVPCLSKESGKQIDADQKGCGQMAGVNLIDINPHPAQARHLCIPSDLLISAFILSFC